MFPFLWRTALDSNAAAHSSFCCDKINFSFQMGRVTCNESCAVMSPSSAYYYEAKIHVQMVSAFHGNQLSRGSSKQKLKFVLSESL